MNIPEPLAAPAHMGSWRWDAETDVVTWSPELYRIFGFDPAQPPPTWEERRQIYTEDSFARLEQAGRQCVETGEPFCVELDGFRRDGTPMHLEGRGESVKDENERLIEIHGVVLDRSDEKKAQEALRESEEQFASAFGYAPIGMALVSPTGQWLKVNRAICEILGYSEPELLEGSFQDITHPGDLEEDMEYVRQMLAGGRASYQMEKRYLHKSGCTVWAHLSVSLVRDTEGHPLNFISQVQDITERRHTAAERDRFFNLSLDLLSVSGLDGYFRQVNPAWTRTLGWSEAELLACPIFDLLHPDDLEITQKARDALASGHPPIELENRYRCKEGGYRWLSWQSFALPEEGTVFAVARDITERKKAEEERRVIANRLHLATELSGIGVFDYDIFTDTLVWDERQYQIYGLDPAAGVPGLDRWHAAIHPEDRDAMESARLQAMADPTRNFDQKYRIVRASDGATRHLHSVARIERDAARQPIRIVGMNFDITEELNLQEHLRRASATAEAASRAKSEFLAMMSHEIRTPMNAVIGYGDLLRRTPLTAEQAEFVSNIRQGGANLIEIIESILDFSKIEAGKLALQDEPVDPRALVEEVCDLLSVTARLRGLAFHRSISPDIPARIKGDSAAIKRVLTNLLGNAIKFTERGSVHTHVTYSTQAGRPWLRIEVDDTGIGLSEEALDRLFQPFSQGDPSNKRKFGGTGLGLVISHRLAEAMDGTLAAESRPEGGSAFIFSFPIREVENGAGPPGPCAEDETSPPSARLRLPRAMRVLLAEDNRVNQKLMIKLLERLACECEAVPDGREALKALKQKNYDAVLLDIQMPVMDGWETAHEIRRREACQPESSRHYIIAQTAYATKEDARKCLEFGMDDHLTKPVTLEALTHALTRAAEARPAVK
jgi:two-component system sensor histidine kinase/response regulator